MKCVRNPLQKSVLALIFAFMANLMIGQTVNLVPTNNTQADFLNAYKLAIKSANNDYHSTNADFDDNLFPLWGEHSVYWIKSGANKGSFVLPDKIPGEYSSVTRSTASNYDWQTAEHYSLQFKANSKSIAIFESGFLNGNFSVNWESTYFQSIITNYLIPGSYYVCNETNIISNGFDHKTKLLIIPAFSQVNGDHKVYIDSVFLQYPAITDKSMHFLRRVEPSIPKETQPTLLKN
ncbi:MAG: hypothetical protein HC831_19245 [Chloroflexia bacterium]|nr:hypothetical protein [Chloroflexia bacterium]